MGFSRKKTNVKTLNTHAIDAKSLQKEVREETVFLRDNHEISLEEVPDFFKENIQKHAKSFGTEARIRRPNALNVVDERILSRKEVDKAVIFDGFFDKSTFILRSIWFRFKQLSGTILVWLVTFVPGIITLMQIYYFFNKSNKKPFLYLDSTLHLFLSFTLSTLVTCIIVTIIIILLALYRYYFKTKSIYTEKWQKHRQKQLATIQEKELLLNFHFDPLLGDEVERKNKRWMTIHPERNIDKDTIVNLYKEHLGHDLKNEWKEE